MKWVIQPQRTQFVSIIFHHYLYQKCNKTPYGASRANDVRVLQVESDEIVAGVKMNGVPVEYIIFDDEGHGFRKKENEIKGYGQIKEFLDQYLKGEGDSKKTP